MRFYASCRSFSQIIGRVAGLYKKVQCYKIFRFCNWGSETTYYVTIRSKINFVFLSLDHLFIFNLSKLNIRSRIHTNIALYPWNEMTFWLMTFSNIWRFLFKKAAAAALQTDSMLLIDKFKFSLFVAPRPLIAFRSVYFFDIFSI